MTEQESIEQSLRHKALEQSWVDAMIAHPRPGKPKPPSWTIRSRLKRHGLSFVRGPLGYTANFVSTFTAATGLDRWEPIERVTCWACGALCLRDGIQDDWHPAFPPYNRA